jgi:WD40 repeat protein
VYSIDSIAYSPTGDFVALGSAVVDVPDCREITPMRVGHDDRVTAVAISPDGSLIASGQYGRNSPVFIWDRATGHVRHQFTAPTGTGSMAFSPDGRTLAIGCTKRSVLLCDVETGELLRALALKARVRALAWTPDGQSLLVAESYGADGVGALKLFDAKSGNFVREFLPDKHGAFAIAVSPDGRLVAADVVSEIAQGIEIVVCDIATGEIVAAIPREQIPFDHRTGLPIVSPDPDGTPMPPQPAAEAPPDAEAPSDSNPVPAGQP